MTIVCTIKQLFTAYLTNLAKSHANLALPKIINYDLRVSRKRKLTFKIVKYNCGAFIVKATGG